MARPRRTPWFAVDVDIRKDDRLVDLPSDTARYGYIVGVLAEARLATPRGVFASRTQLEEALGRFGRFIPQYLSVGVLEPAGGMCDDCRAAFGAVRRGSIVVHNWVRKQTDPRHADRQAAYEQRQKSAESDGESDAQPDGESDAITDDSVYARAPDETLTETRNTRQDPPRENLSAEDRARAALKARGYKRVSAKQLAMLAEIADRESWPRVLGWIATAPEGTDPLAHVKATSNGERTTRLRKADERERRHQATKNGSAGPIAAELASVIGSARNGQRALSRDEAIDRWRPYLGQIEAAALERQIAPYGLTLADLEDPVDFTAPQEAAADD